MKRYHFQWHHAVLALVLLVSVGLNIYGLNQEGYANTYYATAVKSMMLNWHNFFYNSFDPNGFITIDKPPVEFWLQALFAWVLGFHGWALILPQAIAGVLSVFVLYRLVKRVFGTVAGLISAAVLALTPIAVAVQRTNQVDGMLVLVMLLATWCVWKAIETRKLYWLISVGVLEGIGFNIKMMEAYLILPALYVGYYLATKLSWRKKIVNLLAMTAVLAALSFSWALAVDLTPANDRPYVGSTQTNSEMELIFGYNGISRLTGNAFGGQGSGGSTHNFARPGKTLNRLGFAGGYPPGGPHNHLRVFNGRSPRGQSGGPGGGGTGLFNTGYPGVLRLFQSELSGQISWFLPIALLALIPLLRNMRWRRALTRQEQGAIIWAGWLLPMAVFYSIAGFFHQYYLITMAPGIAALTGAGLVRMWRDFAAKNAWRWYLPIAFAVNLGFALSIVRAYASVSVILTVSSVSAAVIAVLFLWRSHGIRFWKVAGFTAGLLALLIAPAYWSLTPILYGVNGVLPAAGPQQNSLGGGKAGNVSGPATSSTSGNATLEAYLEKHYKASPGSYLLATQNANSAGPIILDTGLPVMAMGGFLGTDPAITVQKLEQLTASGKLKYFLLQSGGFGGGSQSSVTRWITAHSKVVPSREWQSTSSKNAQSGMQGGTKLYEYVG